MKRKIFTIAASILLVFALSSCSNVDDPFDVTSVYTRGGATLTGSTGGGGGGTTPAVVNGSPDGSPITGIVAPGTSIVDFYISGLTTGQTYYIRILSGDGIQYSSDLLTANNGGYTFAASYTTANLEIYGTAGNSVSIFCLPAGGGAGGGPDFQENLNPGESFNDFMFNDEIKIIELATSGGWRYLISWNDFAVSNLYLQSEDGTPIYRNNEDDGFVVFNHDDDKAYAIIISNDGSPDFTLNDISDSGFNWYRLFWNSVGTNWAASNGDLWRIIFDNNEAEFYTFTYAYDDSDDYDTGGGADFSTEGWNPIEIGWNPYYFYDNGTDIFITENSDGSLPIYRLDHYYVSYAYEDSTGYNENQLDLNGGYSRVELDLTDDQLNNSQEIVTVNFDVANQNIISVTYDGVDFY